MKKILIHSIVFSPDGVSTAYLYNDIALRLAKSNLEVVVLTTTPHYNIVDSEVAKQPLKRKLFGLFYESRYHGIRVIHIPQKKFKNVLMRLFCISYWHILSFVLGLAQKNIGVIISPSPPLTIGLINILIAKLKGAKTVYNVQEIYPDFLVNQGGLKSKPIIALLKRLEKFVYNNSTAVTTIDEVFYNSIVGKFQDKSKLRIIPNFVDTELYFPIPKSELKLDPLVFPPDFDGLRIMYAGNIGYAQDWEPLVEIAKRVKDHNIGFWIIGEGAMKSYLEEEIAKNKLTNIKLIAYQKRELMPQIVAYADVHFIFMTPVLENDGFPSKVYTLMACAKPLIIISSSGTPIDNFVKPFNSAFVVNEKNFEEKCTSIVDFLTYVQGDRQQLELMGNNGFKVIENQYSSRVVTAQYLQLCKELL